MKMFGGQVLWKKFSIVPDPLVKNVKIAMGSGTVV